MVATSYKFTGLACGKSYTLGVAAYDARGNVSATAPLVAATAACPPRPDRKAQPRVARPRVAPAARAPPAVSSRSASRTSPGGRTRSPVAPAAGTRAASTHTPARARLGPRRCATTASQVGRCGPPSMASRPTRSLGNCKRSNLWNANWVPVRLVKSRLALKRREARTGRMTNTTRRLARTRAGFLAATVAVTALATSAEAAPASTIDRDASIRSCVSDSAYCGHAQRLGTFRRGTNVSMRCWIDGRKETVAYASVRWFLVQRISDGYEGFVHSSTIPAAQQATVGWCRNSLRVRAGLEAAARLGQWQPTDSDVAAGRWTRDRPDLERERVWAVGRLVRRLREARPDRLSPRRKVTFPRKRLADVRLPLESSRGARKRPSAPLRVARLAGIGIPDASQSPSAATGPPPRLAWTTRGHQYSTSPRAPTTAARTSDG